MVSVIICTHNPREDYLRRVLQALRYQTLPFDQWELLLIDNASYKSLADISDLSWHPFARYVREEELGLTPARLRGIAESTGELLVFADDDNVFCEDYLQSAVRIFRERPYIGAFSGSVAGEFEETPCASIRKYLFCLAIEEIKQDYWGNATFCTKAFPFGAGLCISRAVADRYSQLVQSDGRRKQLGRAGNGLSGHEDCDLALCATDLGLGTGRFQTLRLTHLIPKRRLTEEYIVRLVAEGEGSFLLLTHFRGIEKSAPQPRWVELAKLCGRMVKGTKLDRRIIRAKLRAQTQARQLLQSHEFVADDRPTRTMAV